MGFLTMIGLFFVLVYVAMWLNRRDEKRYLEEVLKSIPKCPPHRWEWKKQPGMDTEYLYCEKCKSVPNVTGNE